jgi:hypothetical protein
MGYRRVLVTPHLDFLAINVDDTFPEIHANRCLGLLWKLAGTKPIGETRLANSRVPDHYDFKDPRARRRKSRAGQRAWESSWLHPGHGIIKYIYIYLYICMYIVQVQLITIYSG